MVLGIHHCEANCLVMNVMDDFYPAETEIFRRMVDQQKISLRTGLCRDLSDAQYDALFDASIIHEKPLENALGSNFRNVLTRERAQDLFVRM